MIHMYSSNIVLTLTLFSEQSDTVGAALHTHLVHLWETLIRWFTVGVKVVRRGVGPVTWLAHGKAEQLHEKEYILYK